MDLHRVNCAGQGCVERWGCRRYRIRLPEDGQRVSAERLVYPWASFDLERLWFGSCQAFVKFRESRGASENLKNF